MATTPRKDLPSTNAPNWNQRVTEELRVLMGRAGNGRALTARDLIDSGIAKPAAGGGLVPGGAGEYQPDLTPPPTPTGFVANSAISNIVIEHDAPAYTQGHGHGMTVVYGVIHQPDSQLPTFDQAVELMRFAGIVASYSTNPATKWRLWIKWLSADGVLSVAPAGGVNGLGVETGQDVSKLLDALQGKITESQLYEHLGSRIDLLDKEDGPLGRSLVSAAQQQDALNQSVRSNINQMAEGLLEAALAADKALERITDAGVYVDPATGQVKIYGLEQTNEHVTTLQVLLDAVQGQLVLKATTAYVDGAIANATLSPADLILYEGLDARIVEVTQQLDSINGQLSQKASALELQGAMVRLTAAESNLDALNGQIALRVTRAEYEADQGLLNERMNSAEIQLSAIDAPAITATVIAVKKAERDAQKSAEALLRDILSGEQTRNVADTALAFARTELTAKVEEGLSAEATARTELAATVDEQAAALSQESKVRATEIAAEASAREHLAARIDGDLGEVSAAIAEEKSVRTDQTGYLGALYSLRMQLSQGGQLVVGGVAISGTSSEESGPRIDYGVMANSFWIAAPSGSPVGVSNVKPFSVQTTAQTINGVVVPAGVYMDAAYINNVTVLFGRFGTLLADKIQATAISASQLTAGDGVIGGSLKSSNYVAGSSGWMLRPDGMAEFSGVIVRGTVYAWAGQVGGITIASNELHSSNWNNVYGPGGLGWAIRANGQAYFNELNIRGQINGGAFTGYGWPAAGQSGFHLGPNGLLIGNANNSKYFQVTAEGDIYTPAFRVVGGVMTVQQVDVIDTLQIRSGAITAVAPRWIGSVAFFVSTSRTLDDFAVSAAYQNIIYLEWLNNIGGDGLYLNAYRGSGEDSQLVNVVYPGAYARVELLFYANGSYMGSTSVEVFQGIGNYVITPLYAVPLGATRVLVNMPPISRNSPEGQRSLNNIKITTISIKR
ncbi:DUF1983 domain-containing protein [Comamonas testosteroni]|uniref:phage tail tip fiber protein n=1 Tax=Comamonas testosteroni TaxID=285 RepID=UPI00265E52D1|nr:DUF1983 domain-containing protein [Comamonas testosteroni]WKL16546.1 DUF1983 domain-containing protein [Comamonas testosteroni]